MYVVIVCRKAMSMDDQNKLKINDKKKHFCKSDFNNLSLLVGDDKLPPSSTDTYLR